LKSGQFGLRRGGFRFGLQLRKFRLCHCGLRFGFRDADFIRGRAAGEREQHPEPTDREDSPTLISALKRYGEEVQHNTSQGGFGTIEYQLKVCSHAYRAKTEQRRTKPQHHFPANATSFSLAKAQLEISKVKAGASASVAKARSSGGTE
jgi:hypothetical protein